MRAMLFHFLLSLAIARRLASSLSSPSSSSRASSSSRKSPPLTSNLYLLTSKMPLQPFKTYYLKFFLQFFSPIPWWFENLAVLLHRNRDARVTC